MGKGITETGKRPYDHPIYGDAEWDEARGAWIVYDNNPSTARMIKNDHPEEPVFLHNRDNGDEEQFTISYKTRLPIMKSGKFVHEETIETI